MEAVNQRVETYEPIHSEVWKKLDQQAREIHQLKRANSRLKGELRKERRQNAELRKELNPDKKQHYRNGRKRGRTMNG